MNDYDWAVHEEWMTVKKASDDVQVSSSGLVGAKGLVDEYGNRNGVPSIYPDIMPDGTLPPIPTARTTPLTLISVALWLGYRDFILVGLCR